MTLGQRILVAIKEREMSQLKLADKLGVHSTTVSAWITDKHKPDFANRKRIAELTKKPLSFFNPEDENEKENYDIPIDTGLSSKEKLNIMAQLTLIKMAMEDGKFINAHKQIDELIKELNESL